MENKKETKKYMCYDLEVNDDDDTQVDFISEVNDPAIKIEYVAFSKDGLTFLKKDVVKEFSFKVESEEKRMLTGVFMVPDQLIKRVDEETKEEYFVRFSADNIERARNKFFRNGGNKNVDTEHNTVPNGSYVVDSWIVRDENSNPLKAYGFNKVPVGAWVGTVHVPDETHWNDYIKTGKLKGFSVMGKFKFAKQEMIEGFSSEDSSEVIVKYSIEDLKIIDDIADMLLD